MPAKRIYTREILTQQLQDKMRELGHVPTIREVDTDPNMASAKTFLKLNNTTKWSVVLRNAGIEPGWSPQKHYTEQELIDLLRSKYTALGRSPRELEVLYDPDMPAPITYYLRYGVTSWSKVLERVNLPDAAPLRAPRDRPDFEKKALAEGLKEMRTTLRRLPTSGDVENDPTKPSRATYQLRFAATKWIDILERAGLFNPATDLIEFKAQLLFKTMTLGRLPTHHDVLDDPEMEHPEIYTAAFGMSWKDLMRSLEQR